mgnify:CR=1 FL=1
MDRTDEFFGFFSEFNSIGSSGKVLSKTTQNYFHEAADQISTLLDSINHSIEITRDPFIDQYGAILTKRFDMSDDERRSFVKHAAKLITQLADAIKSGKMRLKGSAIDHAIGVLTCLNSSLAKAQKKLALMEIQRKQIQTKLNTLKSNPPPINSKYIHSQNPTSFSDDPNNQNSQTVIIRQEYQMELEREHDVLLTELLDFNNQLIETERQVEEIATIFTHFNTLVQQQTERTHLIRADIEQSTEDYEKGTKEIKASIEKSKMNHLWMSATLLFLAFLMIFKYS